MKFYAKRRARPAVPIITLIDILAILLIFFIVTTTFKKEETLLAVNLPQSSEMAASGETERRVSLALDPSGNLSLGSRPVAIEDLPSALSEWKRANPEAKLELKADAEAQLGVMVRIWDAATQAGVEIRDIPLRILLKD